MVDGRLLRSDGRAGARAPPWRARTEIAPRSAAFEKRTDDESHSVPTARGGLGPIERAVRIVGGASRTVFAADLWLTTAAFIAWAWLAAVRLGLDLVVTGIRGYCRLYARLDIGRPPTEPGA
ncbi:MAG: YgaP family membrane protein [Candidatus Limnocylindrales bacterium]